MASIICVYAWSTESRTPEPKARTRSAERWKVASALLAMQHAPFDASRKRSERSTTFRGSHFSAERETVETKREFTSPALVKWPASKYSRRSHATPGECKINSSLLLFAIFLRLGMALSETHRERMMKNCCEKLLQQKNWYNMQMGHEISDSAECFCFVSSDLIVQVPAEVGLQRAGAISRAESLGNDELGDEYLRSTTLNEFILSRIPYEINPFHLMIKLFSMLLTSPAPPRSLELFFL